MSQLISVVIITYNEEEHISQCIESVSLLAAETIVIDSFSTDQTVQMAKDAGVRVVKKEWNGYGEARNFGASIATNDWIFSIDADERVGDQLTKQVLEEQLQISTLYKMKRSNIYRARKMKFGMLHPQWKTRLYHRNNAEWDLRKVHEQLICKSLCSSKKISGDLIHYAYNSEEELRLRLSKYAKLVGQERIECGKKPNKVIATLSATYHFLRSYFVQLGILEGPFGWETSKASFYYNKEKYETSNE